MFVVLDTVRRERKSWVVWKEEGRTPNVVVELVSESTERVDLVDKMRICARSLHVGEYYIYDPMSHRLDGFRLNPERGQYDPIPPADDGAVWCAQLGLWLGARPGVFGGIDTRWLRWIDEQGQVLPVAAEAEAQRADAESQRADAESQRAEAESRRAEALQAQLAVYETAYGKLPDR